MVGTTRFELVTSTMSTWRSNQLSYAPKEAAIIRSRSLASTQSPFKTIYWIDLACLNLRRKKNPPYGGFNKPKYHQSAHAHRQVLSAHLRQPPRDKSATASPPRYTGAKYAVDLGQLNSKLPTTKITAAPFYRLKKTPRPKTLAF